MSRTAGLALLVTLALPAAVTGQELEAEGAGAASITPERLRERLFAFAHDSMGGRMAGTLGNVKATDYMAAEFARAGLEPAGEDGTFFQTVPIGTLRATEASSIQVGQTTLDLVSDFVVLPRAPGTITVTQAVYGGEIADSTTWIDPAAAAGKLVVLTVPPDASGARRPSGRVTATSGLRRFAAASGVAVAELDLHSAGTVARLAQGSTGVGDPASMEGQAGIIISPAAAAAVLGADPATLEVGAAGPALRGAFEIEYTPAAHPSRNVIAVLRGSDPDLRDEYVALTAHNDHIGSVPQRAEHDSLVAYNTVVRPMGADSPRDEPSAEQWERIAAILTDLRAQRPPRLDSISNGADDDGSGSVALLEIARALGARAERPRRSILFVSHTAEERGLLGSRWFTDRPTVAREGIVAELDMDMVGRAEPTEEGAVPLVVVGSRKISAQYGDLLEEVNATQDRPFALDYEFDAPGHPLQYFCRADHYSYARYNIPAFSISGGSHRDYHQVTDEPQYINYESLAGVARLAHDMALRVANRDDRPALNVATRDPTAPCLQ